MNSPLHKPAKKLVLILGGLLTLRVILLFLAPWGLHGDEAQYWAWSQEPAFGYFSKPPMIAWVIGATTSIFGDAEWAIRLSAPFLHIATSIMIFLAGRSCVGDIKGRRRMGPGFTAWPLDWSGTAFKICHGLYTAYFMFSGPL